MSVTDTERAISAPSGNGVARPRAADLAEISASFERAPATAVVQWAHDRFGDGLVLAASFQDAVLIDIASRVARDIHIVFLDTQYHFAETLWYVERLRERYDLDLEVVRPDVPPDDLWQTDPDACCGLRKVEPLARALAGRGAWMTGLRRSEAPTRATTPIVSFDIARGLVKINPLATWTDADVEGYVRDHDLPVHPLRDHGFASIGCWPCTRAVDAGEDRRAGRWAGLGKTECGLHI